MPDWSERRTMHVHPLWLRSCETSNQWHWVRIGGTESSSRRASWGECRWHTNKQEAAAQVRTHHTRLRSSGGWPRVPAATQKNRSSKGWSQQVGLVFWLIKKGGGGRGWARRRITFAWVQNRSFYIPFTFIHFAQCINLDSKKVFIFVGIPFTDFTIISVACIEFLFFSSWRK